MPTKRINHIAQTFEYVCLLCHSLINDGSVRSDVDSSAVCLELFRLRSEILVTLRECTVSELVYAAEMIHVESDAPLSEIYLRSVLISLVMTRLFAKSLVLFDCRDSGMTLIN